MRLILEILKTVLFIIIVFDVTIITLLVLITYILFLISKIFSKITLVVKALIFIINVSYVFFLYIKIFFSYLKIYEKLSVIFKLASYSLKYSTNLFCSNMKQKSLNNFNKAKKLVICLKYYREIKCLKNSSTFENQLLKTNHKYIKTDVNSLKILNDWLRANEDHPYATYDQKEELARLTNLSLYKIEYWLKYHRYKIRKNYEKLILNLNSDDIILFKKHYEMSRQSPNNAELLQLQTLTNHNKKTIKAWFNLQKFRIRRQ